jgi:hypothetical protein
MYVDRRYNGNGGGGGGGGTPSGGHRLWSWGCAGVAAGTVVVLGLVGWAYDSFTKRGTIEVHV